MGKTHRFTRLLLDNETGEMVDVGPLPKRWSGEPYFVKLYLMNLREIVRNTSLSPYDVRILMLMIAEMREKTNEVLLRPEDIMRCLGISRHTAYGGLKRLRDLGLIIKREPGVFIVSDEVAFRGKRPWREVTTK